MAYVQSHPNLRRYPFPIGSGLVIGKWLLSANAPHKAQVHFQHKIFSKTVTIEANSKAESSLMILQYRSQITLRALVIKSRVTRMKLVPAREYIASVRALRVLKRAGTHN